MRRLVVSIHSTANDIVTGSPSGDETELSWAGPGIEESLDSFHRSLAAVDTILLGRGTYEDLVRKWPAVTPAPGIPELVLTIAEMVNTIPKIVVSRTPLEGLHWGPFDRPRQLTGADVVDQLKALKERDGGTIITFGSPQLVRSLVNAHLVDEFRLLIHPVLVHEGHHLFDNLEGRTELSLLDLEAFPSGAILVTYEVS
ncbi:dihydrofolate reductase [Kribbella amoyensis]|uniref:Dihydrofolate reductase n=1 Tax=Kribbella amoyensis TaxID=996641 RepID=A0A561BR55_9ACTN|nr:dihydrofolate reductase family protein [Kribbella amoyensis]TWD81368.1 dihydrofolate reductase [Kribbella amoyensis]